MALHVQEFEATGRRRDGDQLLDLFVERINRVKSHGGYYTGLCPAHDDNTASLSFRAGDSQEVVARCHAGCTWDQILAAVAPDWKQPAAGSSGSETIYPYRDEEGNVLFEVVRGTGKNFRCQTYDPKSDGWKLGIEGVRRVPYNLPEVITAVREGRTIYVVEGEKDADRLTTEGLVATTNPFGAGKWDSDWAPLFKDARVVILPDNDDEGRRHAETVERSLNETAHEVAIIELPGLEHKGDVSDWFADGHTVAELGDLIDSAPGGMFPVFKTYSIAELGNLPPAQYLIDGFVQKQALNLLIGPSGIGKTFVALDMALSIATNRPWHGHPVLPGTVLYIAAEGVAGIHSRVGAWRNANTNPDRDRIRFASEPLSLLKAKDVDRIIQVVSYARFELVVIDPLARFMEGGDENSSKDMSTAVAGLSRIQRETGATLLVPHHTGKDTGRGARGHSSLLAAVDHELTMRTRGANVEIRVTKARDLVGGEFVTLRLEPLGRSAVFRRTKPASDRSGLTSDARRALETLADIEDGATSTEWQKATGMEKSAFQRARMALTTGGKVEGGGGKGSVYQATFDGLEALERYSHDHDEPRTNT